jgi:hypothetical protein
MTAPSVQEAGPTMTPPTESTPQAATEPNGATNAQGDVTLPVTRDVRLGVGSVAIEEPIADDRDDGHVRSTSSSECRPGTKCTSRVLYTASHKSNSFR